MWWATPLTFTWNRGKSWVGSVFWRYSINTLNAKTEAWDELKNPLSITFIKKLIPLAMLFCHLSKSILIIANNAKLVVSTIRDSPLEQVIVWVTSLNDPSLLWSWTNSFNVFFAFWVFPRAIYYSHIVFYLCKSLLIDFSNRNPFFVSSPSYHNHLFYETQLFYNLQIDFSIMLTQT